MLCFFLCEPAFVVVVIALRFCVCFPLSLCALVSAWLCLRLHVYVIWVSALVIVIVLAPALVHVRLRLHYFVFVHVGVCVLVHAPAVFMPLFPCLWLCLFTRLYLFFFLCVFAHSRFFVRAHILCMCACLRAFVHVSMWLRAFVRAWEQVIAQECAISPVRTCKRLFFSFENSQEEDSGPVWMKGQHNNHVNTELHSCNFWELSTQIYTQPRWGRTAPFHVSLSNFLQKASGSVARKKKTHKKQDAGAGARRLFVPSTPLAWLAPLVDTISHWFCDLQILH